MNLPLVSIIVPMRNEAQHIEQCLHSIINCNYPKNSYEIIVVDGMSTDGSKEIVQSLITRYNNIRLLENLSGITPTAFNIGIKAAKGEIIAIVSAHGYIERDFLNNGVKCLIQMPEIDCVGGPAIATATNFFGKMVAFVTSSKFGTGARFRYSTKNQYIDTVPFPIFRKQVFKRIGLYNEKLGRNQDIEFNYRLKKSGGKIYFSNKVRSYVFVRSSIRSILKYNFIQGMWNVYTNRIFKHAFAFRHFIPFFFVLSLFISFGLALFTFIGKIFLALIVICYFATDLIYSIKLSMKYGIKYFPFLPILFFSYHFSYGMGTLKALITKWTPISD